MLGSQRVPSVVLERICAEAGVEPEHKAPAGVEVVRRHGTEADYLFLIDHTGGGADIPAQGVELLTGEHVSGTVTVPPGGVAVVRESHLSEQRPEHVS